MFPKRLVKVEIGGLGVVNLRLGDCGAVFVIHEDGLDPAYFALGSARPGGNRAEVSSAPVCGNRAAGGRLQPGFGLVKPDVIHGDDG